MKLKSRLSKLLFPFIGMGSLIWFLIRVIPKPSRATYPCMRVAYPMASAFVTYVIGLALSVFAFQKMKAYQKRSKYWIATVFFIIAIVAGLVSFQADKPPVFADSSYLDEPNVPMGEANGIFPGRVVWIHDADATNEELTNPEICNGDGWFKSEHNDQDIIDNMLDKAVKEITGQTDVVEAWDVIFKYNNAKRGKGEIGYQFDQNEKIFIKINRTSAWGMGGFGGNIQNDFTRVMNTYFGTSETSPQLILSLLRQLVNQVGVDQSNIYIGDPMKHIYKSDYDLWKPEFSDVHYLDHDRTDGGREIAANGDSTIYYSDHGKVLRTGSWSNMGSGDPVYQDKFYKIFENCEYLINVPTLKGHRRAGITQFAKNHFGSHIREDAKHLHMGLVCPDEPNRVPANERHDYGMYRVQVDLMGWELIRTKDLVYLMDGLWSAGHECIQPSKWETEPFNNDWSSSLFISLDEVAIESVGYDFLKHEYTQERHPDLTYPQMEGADDYLHQAADSANWPEDVTYDPENDGTPIASLGVHEHWNNPADKEYSRNLGENYGIELVTRDATNDTQDDTVIVHHVANVPVIDGNADDLCWSQTDWQEIGQTWMPYDKFILSDDFTGRYKCVWNQDSNLVYFLTEIKDDALVDGYQLGEDNYYKYDVLELFVDEDHSGGEHRIDWGSQNAENAFAYHMNVNFPGIGNTTSELVAMDQYEGTQLKNYNHHFPEFVLKQYNCNNIYEFSLKLYGDDFDVENPEASRVILEKNKMIGFSMAYCDNDDPDENPKTRDNFFGSVEVAHQDSNNHWINADHFGTMMLVDTTQAVAVERKDGHQISSGFSLAQNYPNPFNPMTSIEYNIPSKSHVKIIVLDMTGRRITTLVNEEQNAGVYLVNWNASNLPTGVYFYKIRAGKYSAVKKCTLIK